MKKRTKRKGESINFSPNKKIKKMQDKIRIDEDPKYKKPFVYKEFVIEEKSFIEIKQKILVVKPILIICLNLERLKTK